jgi:hypothetical protein
MALTQVLPCGSTASGAARIAPVCGEQSTRQEGFGRCGRLLAPQRDKRIDGGGTAGGQRAGEEPGKRQDCERSGEDPDVVRLHLEEEAFQAGASEKKFQGSICSARGSFHKPRHAAEMELDRRLVASALVGHLELWTADPRLATVAAELGIGYESPGVR